MKFFFHCLCVLSYTTYLSHNQWNHIKHILENPESTDEIVFKTKKVIFTHFEKWAINKAYEFSRKYRYHKELNPKELSLYALSGLERAILKYNTCYSFIHHAEFYVSASLFDGITDLQPMNSLPKSYRRTKSWRRKYPVLYEQLLKTQFVGSDDWILDEYNKKENVVPSLDTEIEIWAIVETFDILRKKIFTLKYHPQYQFSNKEISNQLGYSEENIRLYIKKMHKEILSILNRTV